MEGSQGRSWEARTHGQGAEEGVQWEGVRLLLGVSEELFLLSFCHLLKNQSPRIEKSIFFFF